MRQMQELRQRKRRKQQLQPERLREQQKEQQWVRTLPLP